MCFIVLSLFLFADKHKQDIPEQQVNRARCTLNLENLLLALATSTDKWHVCNQDAAASGSSLTTYKFGNQIVTSLLLRFRKSLK